MTEKRFTVNEKRFRVQEHCLRSSYGIEAENWLVTNDNHGVVLTNKSEAHMVANMFNDVIGVLNELNDENQQLKQHLELYQPNKDERSNFDLNLCCEKNNELLKENKELKKTVSYFAEVCACSIEILNEDENLKKVHSAIICTEMQELLKENKELKNEIEMLKTIIGKNEYYIGNITHKGKWR